MPETETLDQKAGIVIGASSGIGEATARALADEGVRVALAARNESKLDELADEIESNAREALVIPTDIRNQNELESLFEKTYEKFGSLDILVNSAGVIHWEPVAQTDPDELKREIEVNLLGLMNSSRLASRLMIEQGSGHIVNVSSLAGRYPGPGGPGYTATKFGVNGFTESILRDLRENGIRVTLIEPGEVDTPMQSEEDREKMRMLDPEDVADAIVYAVSRPEHVCVNDIQIIPTPEKDDEEE